MAPALRTLCVRANSDVAAYKRGTDGRSSFSGNVVTVLGASGFLGRYVVNKLGMYKGSTLYWINKAKAKIMLILISNLISNHGP